MRIARSGMRQVYKGEIEEKTSSCTKQPDVRIMLLFALAVKRIFKICGFVVGKTTKPVRFMFGCVLFSNIKAV